MQINIILFIKKEIKRKKEKVKSKKLFIKGVQGKE